MTSRRRGLLLSLIVVAIAVVSLPFVQMASPEIPLYGKGGVGIIAPRLYVITKSKENTVLWGEGGRHEWIGRGIEQSETVLADDAGVIPFSLAALLHIRSYPVLVRFTPEKIYFYDFASFEGGHYRRSIDENARLQH